MNLVFDIGANAGDTVEQYLKVSDKVIAFEPNPNLVKKLKTRFSGNPNVIVDNRGLDNKVGVNSFRICDATTLSTYSDKWIESGRFSEDQVWEINIETPVTTLDSIIEQYGIPDLIKIDVEGYEKEVIRGLTQLLPDTIIGFEWVEEMKDDILETIQYVQNLGYSAFSFTYKDEVITDIGWATWENLGLGQHLVPSRKSLWGMIYFKKEKLLTDKDPKEQYALIDNTTFSVSDCYMGYVNMDSRNDRREHMERELERVGLFAIRHRGYTPEEVRQVIPDNKLQVMLDRTPGAVGCWYSQTEVMKEALRQGKHAWVMEDDLVYCDDLKQRLTIIEEFLSNNEWDIFWLGGTYHSDPTWHRSENGRHTHPDMQMCTCNLNRDWGPTDNDHIVKTYGIWSTYSYIVNSKSIEKILDRLDCNMYRSMGIDWCMILLQPDLQTFSFNPGCCRQFDNQSNIGSGITYFSIFQSLGEHWFKQIL